MCDESVDRVRLWRGVAYTLSAVCEKARMIKIKWDYKYEIGNERIDHEHRVFLGLIKKAAIASDQGADKDRVLRLLVEILKYADFHFYSEENIMLDVAYPDYDSHHQAHQQLLGALDEMYQSYRLDVIKLIDVVEFLMDWFSIHTTQVDKKIAQYLESLQVSADAI